MLGQVGPQKLLEQLKAQAPLYAKLLPELPTLLRAYLRRGATDNAQAVAELLLEQRRTNHRQREFLQNGGQRGHDNL